MIYSVWKYGNGFDYYEAPSDGKTHAGTPPRARGAAQLGATPEQAAWPLPLGARLVGSGPTPKGRIASLGDTASSSGSLLSFVSENAGMVTAGAVIAYYLWRKKR